MKRSIAGRPVLVSTEVLQYSARVYPLSGSSSFTDMLTFETIMNVENTEVQMRKGVLEFCILSIISRGEVYASDMLDELTQARIVVVEGTLYPLLNRLRKANLVDYRWVESPSGPPRKYYRLTQEGKEFLERLQNAWNELVGSTNAIIERK
jgi:PadR family transcriptional regulator PadR